MPVLWLAGACLASVTLAGCQTDTNRAIKKDTTPPGTAWNQPRQGQTGSNNALPGGTTVSTPSGGTGAAAASTGTSTGAATTGGGSRGPASDYPDGNSIRPTGGGTGGNIDRTSYPGSPGADLNGGRSTAPANTSTNNFGDPPAPARPLASTLPPMPPSGDPPIPRIDENPAARMARPPVSVPAPLPPLPAGAADAMPPPLPPSPVTDSLPPMNPPGRTAVDVPVPPPAQVGPPGPPLPPIPPPLPPSAGIPGRPQNQANFQN